MKAIETVQPMSSIKLIKNSKGYSYEIKIYNEAIEKIPIMLDTVEKKLAKKYKRVKDGK